MLQLLASLFRINSFIFLDLFELEKEDSKWKGYIEDEDDDNGSDMEDFVVSDDDFS